MTARVYWWIVAAVVAGIVVYGARQPNRRFEQKPVSFPSFQPTETPHLPTDSRTKELAHWRGLVFGLGPLAVRTNAMQQLVRLHDVESVPPLIKLLGPPPARSAYQPPPALKPALVDTLVGFGAAALPHLNALVIEGECDSREMERGVAEVLVRIGHPAVPVLAADILRWKIYPDPAELRLWVDVLQTIDDPSAGPALARAADQGLQPAVPMPAFPPPTRITPLTPLAPQGKTIPSNGVVRIRLESALLPPDAKPDRAREPVEIELVRRDGQWESTCWGYSIDYNKREHPGQVQIDATTATVRVKLAVLDDPWIKGGFGEFTIDLAAQQYNGNYNHQPVAGAASLTTWDQQWPQTPPDPVAQNEHPRLIFRPRDLPMLRAKARTEFGQRVVQNLRQRLAADKTLYLKPVNGVTNWKPGMDLAIGHAFLANLFDDPGHGRRAAALIIGRSREMPYWGEHGERLPDPVFLFPFAYDMAWPFLTEEERREAGDAMESFCGLMPQRWGLNQVFAAGHPPRMYPIPGLMALARWREAAPFDLLPPEPVLPFLELSPPIDAGTAPENKFEAGTLIQHWNESTTTATVNLVDQQFDQLKLPVSPMTLECRLRVDQPTGCLVQNRYPLGLRWSRLWIDGIEIEQPTVVNLLPGLHAVRLVANDHTASPIFAPADAPYARALVDRDTLLQQRWNAARAKHARDGESAKFAFYVDACARGTRLWAWHYQQSGQRAGSVFQWPFVSAVWKVTGAGCDPDTPLPAAHDPQRFTPELENRSLVFLMGVVPELSGKYSQDDAANQSSCLDLVTAFVNYPAQ